MTFRLSDWPPPLEKLAPGQAFLGGRPSSEPCKAWFDGVHLFELADSGGNARTPIVEPDRTAMKRCRCGAWVPLTAVVTPEDHLTDRSDTAIRSVSSGAGKTLAYEIHVASGEGLDRIAERFGVPPRGGPPGSPQLPETDVDFRVRILASLGALGAPTMDEEQRGSK